MRRKVETEVISATAEEWQVLRSIVGRALVSLQLEKQEFQVGGEFVDISRPIYSTVGGMTSINAVTDAQDRQCNAGVNEKANR